MVLATNVIAGYRRFWVLAQPVESIMPAAKIAISCKSRHFLSMSFWRYTQLLPSKYLASMLWNVALWLLFYPDAAMISRDPSVFHCPSWKEILQFLSDLKLFPSVRIAFYAPRTCPIHPHRLNYATAFWMTQVNGCAPMYCVGMPPQENQ